VLFRAAFLEMIAAGKVTVAFRRWRRPTVKAGGSLRTPIGVLAIDAVETIEAQGLRESDARKAGFASLSHLQADLAAPGTGTLYRIRFRLAGADPRIALREQAELTDADVAHLGAKLARLDRGEAWTARTLRLIADCEGRPARELAERLGRDKDALKLDIRKLKNLGLTESLGTGYRVSPRGLAWLRRQLELAPARPENRPANPRRSDPS
jgi:predicted transcriptional regulator